MLQNVNTLNLSLAFRSSAASAASPSLSCFFFFFFYESLFLSSQHLVECLWQSSQNCQSVPSYHSDKLPNSYRDLHTLQEQVLPFEVLYLFMKLLQHFMPNNKHQHKLQFLHFSSYTCCLSHSFTFLWLVFCNTVQCIYYFWEGFQYSTSCSWVCFPTRVQEWLSCTSLRETSRQPIWLQSLNLSFQYIITSLFFTQFCLVPPCRLVPYACA